MNTQLWKIRKKQITKLNGILKKNSKHTYCYLVFILMIIMLLGRRPDEEGIEDNGLEEDSGDGQVCEAVFEVK